MQSSEINKEEVKAPPLIRLLNLNQKVLQKSEAEIIFNNIYVIDKLSPEKRRYECTPFFDMSMEDKYSVLAPEYYRAPNTISESLLLANFLELYQNKDVVKLMA
eukprot:gnl/Chilomastix_caulleri/2285.p1 GENE.gnl/Chilomastix_caulleri/2285~~gnl/Chilomastix_caulleri/2285.p1  ORF type:complete len:104 (+),score=10.01 gnl/Chilomastix_caulleri/2285:43-354(+)